jgi:hypothetical protein
MFTSSLASHMINTDVWKSPQTASSRRNFLPEVQFSLGTA